MHKRFSRLDTAPTAIDPAELDPRVLKLDSTGLWPAPASKEDDLLKTMPEAMPEADLNLLKDKITEKVAKIVERIFDERFITTMEDLWSLQSVLYSQYGPDENYDPKLYSQYIDYKPQNNYDAVRNGVNLAKTRHLGLAGLKEPRVYSDEPTKREWHDPTDP